MNQNNIPIRQYLIDSAIADIAINDLGLTLDEPEFSGSLCPWAEYNENECNDSNIVSFKHWNTLTYMTYYLCLLKGGFGLAIKLAKKGGLLNCKISYTHIDAFNCKHSCTQIVTEDYIKWLIKSNLEDFMLLKRIDIECELATHYKQLFKSYCLKHMDDRRLNMEIRDKIETYLNR